MSNKAKFELGQRVKVKGCCRHDLSETVVTKIDHGIEANNLIEALFGAPGWFYVVEGIEHHVPEQFVFPIDDDRYQAGSWDECVWKPEKILEWD